MLSWVVSTKSGIKTLAQLKGKKVAVQQEGAIAVIQVTLIRAAGLDPDKDIVKVPAAGVTESVDALMEGRVDASWASVGMSKIQEATATWLKERD